MADMTREEMMAAGINPDNVLDPYLYYSTPQEAAATGYGSPAEERLWEWAKSADVGSTFDLYKNAPTQGNIGLSTTLTGYTADGKPMLQTNVSPERADWRGTLGDDFRLTPEQNIAKLTAVGYDPQMARFLVAKQFGWDYVLGSGGGTGGAGGTSGMGGPGGTGGTGTGGAYGPGSAGYADRQSAYNLLYNQFKQYGLESLVEGIKDLITSNVSPAEFSIRLQDTDAYKKRFAANQDRIKAGLRALTPAEYIGLEDQYQNIMRNYGLPASYWSKDSMGTQSGFNKFIANDVSAAELEDRIATAQKRVINADVNVKDALRQFYPDITNADILAYTLDPTNALENIKRKVTAAEIGGAALQQGLGTNVGRAEELAKYGITKAQAQQGYGVIGEFLPTATKLGDIYANQGLGGYDQLTAEQEVFGTSGSADAATKRKKLAELEKASFGAQSGLAQGALARDRAGAY